MLYTQTPEMSSSGTVQHSQKQELLFENNVQLQLVFSTNNFCYLQVMYCSVLPRSVFKTFRFVLYSKVSIFYVYLLLLFSKHILLMILYF